MLNLGHIINSLLAVLGKIQWYRWFVLVFLFLHFFPISGQEKEIKIHNLNSNNGLPSNIVHDILQDNRDFIWIATANGLCRFDGKNIRTYKHNPFDRTSIENNIIRSLHLDKEDRLWVGTNKGLSRFLPDSDQFINYSDSMLSEKSQLSSIEEDRNGNLWLFQPLKNKIYLFDPGEKRILFELKNVDELSGKFESPKFQVIDKKNRLWFTSKTHTYCVSYNKENYKIEYHFEGNYHKNINQPPNPANVLCRSDGKIYSSNHGLFSLNEQNPDSVFWEPIHIIGYEGPLSVAEIQINDIEDGGGGFLWIASDNYGLIKYNTNTAVSHSNSQHIKCPVAIEIDKSGRVWVFDSNSCITLMGPYGRLIQKWSQHNNKQTYVSKFNTTQNTILFQGRSDVVWLNTFSNGVHYVPMDHSNFQLFRHEKDKRNSLSSNAVWGICEDHKKRLWIGSDGLDMYNPKNGEFKHFSRETHPDLKYINGTVSSILEISKNNFFVSCSGRIHWLVYKNGTLKKIRDYYPKKDDANSPAAWAPLHFMKDHENKIWISSINGLSTFQPPQTKNSEGNFKNYHFDENCPNSIPTNSVWYTYEDSRDRIWLCSPDGLYSFSPESQKFSQLTPIIEGDSLKTINAKSIWESPKQIFWIATEGTGLIKYDENSEAFEQFWTFNGFPSDNLYSVLPDSLGHIWISSSNGLIRFNTSTNQSYLFTKEDGLQGNEFKAGAFHKGKQTGKIYVGGNNGLNAFYPEDVVLSDYCPKLHFTKFKLFNKDVNPGERVNGKVLLSKAIENAQRIDLEYGENFFSIGFSALDYQAPDKLRYKYQMDGLEKTPTVVSQENAMINYSGLQPGSYVFRVRSTNSDGIWQNNEIRLKMNIHPPWWNTYWAFFIYLLVILIFLLVFQKIVLFRLKYKSQLDLERVEFEKKQIELDKQKELDEAKTRFFMNVSHEFRTQLTLILAPLEKLLYAKDIPNKHYYSLTLIKRNANRFLRLITQLLDFRQIDKQLLSLSLSSGSVSEFVSLTAEAFKDIAERNHIDFKIDNFINEVHYQDQHYFDHDKLEKVLFNLLSNAFKFTPSGGKITISLSRDTQNFHIAVSDSGQGIPEKHLPNIFERFYRVHDTGPDTNGTGIGLSLAKSLVELHKGEIKVESTPNKGSVFSFSIPANLEVQFPEAIIQDKMSFSRFVVNYSDFDSFDSGFNETPGEDKPILLIVEDNQDLCRFIKHHFGKSFQVFVAENGESGLEMAKRKIPDLIISDVMMPEMDGIQLTRKLKTNELTSHIPVVLLTAKTSDEAKIQGLTSGADDYITKPFHLEMLSLKVKNLLNLKEKIKFQFTDNNPIIPNLITSNKTEEQFISRAIKVVENNLQNDEFNTEEFTVIIGMSRSQLYRKIKSLTGQNINEFIRTIRLKYASDLLINSDYTIGEISFLVGYKTPSLFTSNFNKHFGITPSEFIKKNK